MCHVNVKVNFMAGNESQIRSGITTNVDMSATIQENMCGKTIILES